MINSKAKGARFERELAKILREYGYEARRTAQYCGNTGEAADVVGLPRIHIEAKHQEQMRLYDWIAQAERDCGENLPCVFHKQNGKQILVSMPLEAFITLYKTFYNSEV